LSEHETVQDTRSRIDREREFHDRAFAEGLRGKNDSYYDVATTSRDWYRELLRRSYSGQRVLEYGCGDNPNGSLVLAECGADVTAVDLSPVAVERARVAARGRGLQDRIEFKIMNAETLEFPDDSFGLICGNGIVHHLDLDTAFAEVARVLEPGGIAIFREPMGTNPAVNLYRRLTPAERTDDEHPLVMSDLELARRYFGRVRARRFHLSVLAAIPVRHTRVFPYLHRALDAADRAIMRAIPPARGWGWLIVMELSEPRPAAQRPAPGAATA